MSRVNFSATSKCVRILIDVHVFYYKRLACVSSSCSPFIKEHTHICILLSLYIPTAVVYRQTETRRVTIKNAKSGECCVFFSNFFPLTYLAPNSVIIVHLMHVRESHKLIDNGATIYHIIRCTSRGRTK